MKNYFTISELCISKERVPQHVADKLLVHHIIPMNAVRDEFGAAVYASQKSGYRSYSHEISKGRSGGSQHTFGALPSGHNSACLGAIDWTCENKEDLDRLQALIIKHTPYTRIARYETFIHCDYKARTRRELYKSGSDSKWEFVDFI